MNAQKDAVLTKESEQRSRPSLENLLRAPVYGADREEVDVRLDIDRHCLRWSWIIRLPTDAGTPCQLRSYAPAR
jgi:hypothetical protein